MASFKELVRFGLSPSMLYPDSFDGDMPELYACYRAVCAYPEVEALESFLPDDGVLRKKIINVMKGAGKVLNYNTPGSFQLDGPMNPCSDSPEIRKNAREAICRHIDYAAEAGSPLIVVTGCADKGPEQREELVKRYTEYFLEACGYARQYSIRVLIEPIERHRFKRLLWGPTKECAAFVREMRAQGADNAGLMLDFAHLPLMEETVEQAITDYGDIGFEHVHMGEAVLDESSPFYGHTHPPLGVRCGVFSQADLEDQFVRLFECGFIPKKAGGKRASLSLEVKAYPGVSHRVSALAMYEKCESAFRAAASRLGL